MRIFRRIGFAAACIALLGAAPAASVRVPQAQIDAENARWKSLGATLPPGGIILAHPYAPPYSNRSFVVPYEWYRQFADEMRLHHGEVQVRASALRRDLPVLRFLLQKAYAGYEPARARGWNWNAMFERWDKQLARSGDKRLSLATAFASWGRLESVQLDNHSGVPGLRGFVSGSTSALLAQEPHGACSALRFARGRTRPLDAHDDGQQPHAVREWNGTRLEPAWYVSYPKRSGDASAIRCGTQNIALETIPQETNLPQKPAYTSLGDGIAYLRLPTFTGANDDALRRALSQAKGLGKERLVIFDLRGNGGGNAPSDVLANWFAESAIENAAATSQSGTTSCFTTALSFGLQQQLAAGLKPPVSGGLQQALQQIVDALKGESTPGCAVQAWSKSADRDLRDHRFDVQPQQSGQTRVIALVDAGCGTDCEYLTYVLAGLPDTVIAGESTYGVMGFSQPGYFVLPYSHVPFRLALSRTNPYGDDRSVDGYGIAVDVVLPTISAQSMQSLAALAREIVGT